MIVDGSYVHCGGDGDLMPSAQAVARCYGHEPGIEIDDVLKVLVGHNGARPGIGSKLVAR